MVHDNLLIRTDDSGICCLTMNAPDTINALSDDMIKLLCATLDEIAGDSNVKVVILRSSGAHFCAGHNLKEMSAHCDDGDGGHQYYQDLFARCSAMMLRLIRLPQPVIAQVNGIATAAGCQLVASCDLAVASSEARFATSGVNIGLFCSTPMVALSRNIPRKMAMEMLLLGDFLSAEKVMQLGLINRVVDKRNLTEETLLMARSIADKSPAAIKIGKRAFYEQAEMTLEAAYAYAGHTMAENMMEYDAMAGIEAFVNKKAMPKWK